MRQILEGSRAIALTIKNISPEVISSYPITPQTHIVEDLAKFKADDKADYEYIRAESEFASASIILGASANGSRVYSATSSQGLLLMTEVIYNIAGMRLPIVMTIANRGVSAPITIWNDQQDIMTVRDAGWIIMFAENHQESVAQHILAYKIAEKLRIPVFVNIDGFILTHSYEPVVIPSKKDIKKYLPDFKPKKGTFLDPKNPITMGAFATPEHYMEIRQELHDDLVNSLETINKEYEEYNRIVLGSDKKNTTTDNGLVEYYGSKKAKTIIIAAGSVVGTIKDVVDKKRGVGVLKIKTFRPFPTEAILKIIKKAKYVCVLDKAISLGQTGPIALEIRNIAHSNTKAKVKSYIVGLGGRDITKDRIKKIIKDIRKDTENNKAKFIG